MLQLNRITRHGGWGRDGKRRSLARRTCHGDQSLMGRHDFLYNIQAESSPVGFRGWNLSHLAIEGAFNPNSSYQQNPLQPEKGFEHLNPSIRRTNADCDGIGDGTVCRVSR